MHEKKKNVIITIIVIPTSTKNNKEFVHFLTVWFSSTNHSMMLKSMAAFKILFQEPLQRVLINIKIDINSAPYE